MVRTTIRQTADQRLSLNFQNLARGEADRVQLDALLLPGVLPIHGPGMGLPLQRIPEGIVRQARMHLERRSLFLYILAIVH